MESLVDLTDAEARVALPCKWGVPDDVIPAWVAELDLRAAFAIERALGTALRGGLTGYPADGPGGELGEAYAGFARRHFNHDVDPAQVIPVVDVTAGMRLVLDVLAPPGPVVVPVPAYPPHLSLPRMSGRKRIDLVLDPDAASADFDLDALARAFESGARTLLLTSPHNPLGRAYTRDELEGIRDVVTQFEAFVIADEIHAPLVLSPLDPHSLLSHTPYLSLPGTAEHTVALVAASKAFNIAGLKCAQLVTADEGLHQTLRDVPMARNDSWSSLGVVAAIAAYTQGDDWLSALIDRLDGNRTLLAELLAEHLPQARMRPLEATYLAWLDLRAYGHDNPAARCLERGRVLVSDGQDFHPGLHGHIRLNIGTSPARLREIVERMAHALSDRG